MSTYTQIYYHVIFSTKHREKVLAEEKCEDLFRYIWGLLKNKECPLYRINGMADHLHLLFSLHPSIALSALVKDIKISSGKWIKENAACPLFRHWQDGYGAFTVSHQDRDAMIEYIKNQQEHHRRLSFREELREFLVQYHVPFDERFLG